MTQRRSQVPAEELEKLKNMIFEKNVQDEIFQAIAVLTKSDINFSVISNDFFRKKQFHSPKKPYIKLHPYSLTKIHT